jgi:putative ATP-dependent endonuclease of OLD family
LNTQPASAPKILRLSIERFRGISSLTWNPGAGVNVILGGGDVGKTTILDAIGLLLSPTNATTISDTEYHLRQDESGFSIEAVVALPESVPVGHQSKPAWPWVWNGTEPVVPTVDGEGSASGEPVYRFRVRGTEELELVYELVQPDGTADVLSVALRKAVGLVRLGGDDRNDRDLRLVQGSALDRLLSDKGLRSRLTTEFAKSRVKDELTTDAQGLLQTLDAAFRKKNLPNGLDLAITGSQGLAITALIGLTAQQGNVPLPLASWGSGTRRLAALAVAEQNQGKSPITLVDEAERGLEPYRQRALMQGLQSGRSQVFVTTHSPSAIAAASEASLWYVDHLGRIGSLDARKIARHRSSDPETFLSRLSIVAEGATEVGFVRALLERASVDPLEQYGIHLSDGGGHEATLDLLEALASGGLLFGGFADNEAGQHAGRWLNVKATLGPLLFRWDSGCIEDAIITRLPDDKLEALLVDAEGDKTGKRLRTLAIRAGTEGKDFTTIKEKAGGQLRTLIRAAATGAVPDDVTEPPLKKQYRAHSQDWFKTEDGGRELASKMYSLGLWPAMQPQLLAFCNAIRTVVGLPPLADLPP